MKKSMWVTSPLLYILIIAMGIMSLASFSYNITLGIIELSVTLLLAIILVFVNVRFYIHTVSVLRSAKKILMVENIQSLDDFPLPIAVTGLDGNIVWTNTGFNTVLGGGEVNMGESVLKYIYPRTLNQLSDETGVNISRKEKNFTVYTVKTISSYILYFVDDTFYKQIFKEYTERKTVLAYMSFDNKDELIRGAAGGEESRMVSEVESIIRKWAAEIGGFMKKLSNGRYMLILEENHIDLAKDRRFQVIDRVHEVKNAHDISATVSIGIARGAESNVDAEIMARQALDMALGRGGDQVAIVKKDGTYEFYGGMSKGVEKRDKVRTRVISATLSEYITEADKVYLMGHRYSDLDSVGSAVGMWAVTTKGLKKEAHIVVNKSQSLAQTLIETVEEAYKDKRVFITPSEAIQEITKKSLVIVTDTHSQNFVETKELLELAGNVVVIDHHRMMVDHIRNSVIFYHEPYASSASEMVSELVQYINSNAIDTVDAQALLSGIMLDTKNFVLKTGARTFEAAAYLRRRGADMVRVKGYFANTLDTYTERAQLVASADIFKNCAIACSVSVSGNTRVAVAQAADELLTIQGIKASFVMFETNGTVNISGRSLGDVNVQVILEVFGGGGHLTMAGAQIQNTTMMEAKASLVKVINDKLSQQN